ncbi:MAG: glycosyltransferase family 87 protein [Bacteroidia bacterium]
MNIANRIQKLALSANFRLALLAVIVLVIAVQAVLVDHVANFVIFKTASQRLLNHENLYDYILYGIIWDKFFYTPQFALLFTPFTFIPLPTSIFLWSLLGSLLFYIALQNLPLSNTQKAMLFFIILVEMINSLQNLQTNVLNAALMLFIFICLRDNKPFIAALCIAICISIKIYPAAAGLLFLFYPNKIKFLVGCLVFTLAFFCLPLLVLPKEYLIETLQNWIKTVSDDSRDKFIFNSPSLVGANYTWFSHPVNHYYIQLTGLLLAFAPLVKLIRKQVDTNFILLYLAFIMIFVVIFNHAAESPTYIIAISGAAIWYVISPRSMINNILLILLFVACTLLPTDIYPRWLREEYFMPLKIRVVPCLLIWGKLFYELLSYKASQPQASL